MKIEWGIPISDCLPLKIIPLSNIKWVEVDEKGPDVIVTIYLQKGFWKPWFRYTNKIVIEDQHFIELLLSYIGIAPNLIDLRKHPL